MDIEELNTWRGYGYDDLHLLWSLKRWGFPIHVRLLILAQTRKARKREERIWHESRFRLYEADESLNVHFAVFPFLEQIPAYWRQRQVHEEVMAVVHNRVQPYRNKRDGLFMHICLGKMSRRNDLGRGQNNLWWGHLLNCIRFTNGLSETCTCNAYKGSYRHHMGLGCKCKEKKKTSLTTFEVVTTRKLK